eukprot:1567260-Amphidinium_carterae.1
MSSGKAFADSWVLARKRKSKSELWDCNPSKNRRDTDRTDYQEHNWAFNGCCNAARVAHSRGSI